MDATHPLGRPWGDERRRCGACAWSTMAGPGPKVLRCEAGGRQRISASLRACDAWEAPLDCLDCGACCREAYDAVEVSRQDPVRKNQPAWIVKVEGRYQVRRAEGNRCSALGVGFRCEIYADRPRCCRDFERHGPNCIFARRRVGLSSPWGVST
ncbi:MAG: YkgJ family cysteine cluster protein [Myxococcota bacterium]|nr:YkgJ family cysteine cluster protein [Myxococcota bacterium]